MNKQTTPGTSKRSTKRSVLARKPLPTKRKKQNLLEAKSQVKDTKLNQQNLQEAKSQAKNTKLNQQKTLVRRKPNRNTRQSLPSKITDQHADRKAIRENRITINRTNEAIATVAIATASQIMSLMVSSKVKVF